MRTVDLQRVEQQRADIKRAAIKCFSKKGIQRTTTDDICRVAKISPGRLYYYYTSKSKLLEAVVEDLFPDEIPLYSASTGDGSLVELLWQSLRAVEIFQAEQHIGPTLPLEVIAEGKRMPGVRRSIRKEAARAVAGIRMALEIHKARGTLRAETDIESLTAVLHALATGFTVLRVSDPEFGLERCRACLHDVLRPWTQVAS